MICIGTSYTCNSSKNKQCHDGRTCPQYIVSAGHQARCTQINTADNRYKNSLVGRNNPEKNLRHITGIGEVSLAITAHP
jgi:hypothetical protein